MKTKTLDRILKIVSSLSLLGFFVIPFMPASFPIQYGGEGTVSRWGSRLEYILYFLIPAVAGWLGYLWICRQRSKTEERQMRNERFILWLIILLLLGYHLFLIWSVVQGFQFLQHQTAADIGFLVKAATIAVGLLLAVYGNNLPKTDYLSGVGFRTPWSEKNEEAWMRTQRWVGLFHLIFGILFAVCAAILADVRTSGIYLLSFAGIIVIGSYVLSFLASRTINKAA